MCYCGCQVQVNNRVIDGLLISAYPPIPCILLKMHLRKQALKIKMAYPISFTYFNGSYCIALWLLAIVPMAAYGQKSAATCLGNMTSAVVQQYEFQDARPLKTG